MASIALLAQVGMPVALAVSGIVAWRASKRDNTTKPEKPAWRDDSLDDWRHQRDAEAEAEREARASNPASARESSEQTEHHNRLGG